MVPEDRWSDPLDAQANDVSGQRLWPWQAAPRVAVAVLLLYLLFEYLRLHEILPILGKLRVQTATMAALLLIVIAETARGGVRLTRQSWLLLGFFGLTVFTILPAQNQFRAYLFAYGIALILVGYFGITHILRNERDLKRFLSLLVGIHIYIAVKGILRGYGSLYGLGGYFLGDENDLALAMIVILPFAIYLFRQTRSLPARMFWGAGSAMILLTIVFTASRGGFVGLVAMMLYWVITSKSRAKVICTLALAGTLLFAVTPLEYWERIETIQDTTSGTALKRRNNWAAARRMFLDSPIWGVGGFNFGVMLPDYAQEYSPERRGTRWGRVTHSMYFQLLAEFGLLGVILIGSVLFRNFRDLNQVVSLSRNGGCSAPFGQLADSIRISWVGFLVPAAFLSVLQYPHLYYLTALTVLVCSLSFAESSAMEFEPTGALEHAG